MLMVLFYIISPLSTCCLLPIAVVPFFFSYVCCVKLLVVHFKDKLRSNKRKPTVVQACSTFSSQIFSINF